MRPSFEDGLLNNCKNVALLPLQRNYSKGVSRRVLLTIGSLVEGLAIGRFICDVRVRSSPIFARAANAWFDEPQRRKLIC